MKAYNKPVGYSFTILSILLLILASGCSLTRRLNNNQALVRKITIKGVDKEFQDAADKLIQMHWPHFRLGHLGKVTKSADNLLQIVDFGKQDRGGFAKNFVELIGAFDPGFDPRSLELR